VGRGSENVLLLEWGGAKEGETRSSFGENLLGPEWVMRVTRGSYVSRREMIHIIGGGEFKGGHKRNGGMSSV